MSTTVMPPPVSAFHDQSATIQRNHFIHKSLSSWSLNFCMGCSHGCPICYVADTSTNKQKSLLSSFGVVDPIKEWGNYVLVRPWNRAAFMASLREAEKTDSRQLNGDGNRAVFLCSTTDPYQTIRNPDAKVAKIHNEHARWMVREALVAIRDYSTLNVRILTRSPLARKDFDVFKTFGDRLLLGTSLPTLDSKISRAYEGRAPAPQQRLKLLLDAHEAGIHTYVAVAPVFPESGYQGILDVFNAVKAANPHTIFMEPVNLRLGVAERVQAMSLKDKDGLKIDMKPFTDTTAWSAFAIQSLRDAERAAKEAGVFDRLHLWPDFEALGAQKVLARQPDPHAYLKWLQGYWSRVSEWPGK